MQKRVLNHINETVAFA